MIVKIKSRYYTIHLLGPNKQQCCANAAYGFRPAYYIPCGEPASVKISYNPPRTPTDRRLPPDYFCITHYNRLREPGEPSVREMRRMELEGPP